MPLFRETESFPIFDNVRWFPQLKIKNHFWSERVHKKTNWRVASWPKGSFSDAYVSDMSFKDFWNQGWGINVLRNALRFNELKESYWQTSNSFNNNNRGIHCKLTMAKSTLKNH
jgi:hypothetical protein